MSGGTENTKYYVSGLVKDDGGIAINTGYKKQSLRSNLDQELGSGFQLQVNLSGPTALSNAGSVQQRQFGHQPVPGASRSRRTSWTCCRRRADGQPAAVRLPGQPVRAQQSAADVPVPEERRGRLAVAGYQHAPVDAVPLGQEHPAVHRHRRGGLLPAGQQSGLASRAAVRAQRRPARDGGAEQVIEPQPEPGAERDPHAHAAATRRRDAVDHLGRHSVRGAAPVRDPDPRAHPPRRAGRARNRPPARLCSRGSSRCATSASSGRKRCCWPTGGCCSPRGCAPTAAAPTATPSKFFFYPKVGGLVPIPAAVRRNGRAQAARRVRPDRQPRPVRRDVLTDTTGTIGGASGTYIGNRAGRSHIQPERQEEFEGGLRRHPGQWARRSLP